MLSQCACATRDWVSTSLCQGKKTRLMTVQASGASSWLLSSAWQLRQFFLLQKGLSSLCVCWSHAASRASNRCWTFFDFLVEKLLLTRVCC